MSIVSTSILSADFSNLGQQIQQVEKAGTDWIHLDVMDGEFVPNITFGAPVIKSIRKVTKLTFDVHLMINKPERYIEDFATAGADIITFHPEATSHLEETLRLIKSFNKKAGIAINPSTDEHILNKVLNLIDHIIIMTVNPGFAGQKYIDSQLPKIKSVRKIIDANDRKISLAVDGGINQNTAQISREAGARVFVAGDYIFNSNLTYRDAIMNIRGKD